MFVADYTRRFIWLELSKDEPVTAGIASGFEKMLDKLNRKSNQPVFFYLSGWGGDFYACLKMQHAIARSRSPVIVVAFGWLRSGCFFLTQAGNACYAVPGAKFKFHHATDYYLLENLRNTKMSQLDHQRRLRRLQSIDAVQLMVFTMCGRPIAKIFDLFNAEATLSAKQATEVHLLDKMYDQKEFERDRKTARALHKSKRA